MSKIITPIDLAKQESVRQETQAVIERAQVIFEQEFDNIEVSFDLKGKASGMYKVKYAPQKRSLFTRPKAPEIERRWIRYNPWIFAKHPEDNWNNTIPHEVAHYLSDCMYGLKNIRPHGKEWKHIMRELGAEPTVRSNYDLSGVPQRKTAGFIYNCLCQQVTFSKQRHSKVQSGRGKYACKKCNGELIYSGKKTP